MPIRKYGTSEDSKVLSTDEHDEEGQRKQASTKPVMTDEDRRELAEENDR
jgi:predicted neutral ceramidase superfamily lipid hydrolase